MKYSFYTEISAVGIRNVDYVEYLNIFRVNRYAVVLIADDDKQWETIDKSIDTTNTVRMIFYGQKKFVFFGLI